MTVATPGHETSDRAVGELWQRLKIDGDATARDGLILHFAALVKFVAGRVGAGLPPSVDAQDLASYGMFGLIDAVDRFELERGIRFEAYATTRIRGAILDELRRLDWVPRAVRAQARSIQTGLLELEQRLERSASETELADHLGIGLAELRRGLDDVAAGGMVALDGIATGDDGRPLSEVLADPGAVDPADRVEADDLRATLRESVRRLPDRERHVVALYYFEGMTLGEIGDVLGVTESRVSQIHAKAVLSLRNRIALATRPS